MRNFKNGNHFMKHLLINSLKISEPTRISLGSPKRKIDYIADLENILDQKTQFWAINLFDNTWLYLKGDYSDLSHISYDNIVKARRDIQQRLSDINFDIEQISKYEIWMVEQNIKQNRLTGKQKMNSQKELLLKVLYSPDISYRTFPIFNKYTR